MGSFMHPCPIPTLIANYVELSWDVFFCQYYSTYTPGLF